MNIMLMLAISYLGGPDVKNELVTVSFKVPALQVAPYHKPYVAVWVESEDRQGIKTILVWHEGKDWLKDLRQWWRKLGRNGEPGIDGVTGATQKPGTYSVSWDGNDATGEPLPPGTYYVNIEASRENGGRDFHRQKVFLGQEQPQQYDYPGKVELRDVVIKVK